MLYKIGINNYLAVNYTQPTTTSGLAVSGRCTFHGILLSTDGTNDITLNIYDSTTAAGTRLLPADVTVKAGGDLKIISTDPFSLPCYNGIFVDTVCSGTYSYQIYFDN